MTTTDRPIATEPARRRRLAPAARQAAARAIIKANTANGDPTDPRIVDVAAGKH